MNHSEPITIGRFIEHLEQQDPNHTISFDFCGFVPADFDSYRGFYDQLALGYSDDYSQEVKVSTLLEKAKDTQFKQYTGYKGGSYRMTPETLLWCDNWGQATGTAVVDVLNCEYYVKIVTQYVGW